MKVFVCSLYKRVLAWVKVVTRRNNRVSYSEDVLPGNQTMICLVSVGELLERLRLVLYSDPGVIQSGGLNNEVFRLPFPEKPSPSMTVRSLLVCRVKMGVNIPSIIYALGAGDKAVEISLSELLTASHNDVPEGSICHGVIRDRGGSLQVASLVKVNNVFRPGVSSFLQAELLPGMLLVLPASPSNVAKLA